MSPHCGVMFDVSSELSVKTRSKGVGALSVGAVEGSVVRRVVRRSGISPLLVQLCVGEPWRGAWFAAWSPKWIPPLAVPALMRRDSQTPACRCVGSPMRLRAKGVTGPGT